MKSDKINHKLAARRGYRDLPDTRQHCVSVRFSEAELADLDSRRGRWKRGEWLRMAFLSQTAPTVPEINREAYSELARSAANLNQVAKHLNESGTTAISEAELANIQSVLRVFRAKLIDTGIATFSQSSASGN